MTTSLRSSVVSATSFAFACTAGLYLYNFERNWMLLAPLFFILSMVYTGSFRRFTEPQNGHLRDTEAVLVTGCDTGLGYSLALHLRSLGFQVIASVHKKESPGALELSAMSGVFVHPLELTNCESVKAFGSAVSDYLDRNGFALRAFVNNAGILIFGEFEWQTEEQTRHQIEVNVLGTMRVTRELMPVIRTHFTRLIVVSSHCASEPLPGVATYGATKAALTAWSTALRVELKKFDIDVVNFIPGSFVGESNLLSQQKQYFEVMDAAMTTEMRSFYGDYFTKYVSWLSDLASSNLPQKLTNPRIYKVFEDALFDRLPRAVYMCEPWRYTLYHIMFKITSTPIRDRLVACFVQFPVWKNSERNKQIESEEKPRRCWSSRTSTKVNAIQQDSQ